MTQTNDQLVLIGGESGSGKSASLKDLPNPERVMYLNCESGKKLPFRNKFQNYIITDPYQVYEAFQATAQGGPLHDKVDIIAIDTITFLMEMFESIYVVNSANTMAAWGDYFQFFKNLMQVHVAGSDKSVIILGHTRTDLNEATMEMQTAVPVKGSLKNNGIEAYFSTVVATKKIPLTKLEDQDKALLHITEDDELLGYKHVFQTRLTKETRGERIRSPLGMFSKNQTYMDNDANLLLKHLTDYYGS